MRDNGKNIAFFLETRRKWMEGKKSLAYPGEKNHDRTRSPQLCAELEGA